MLLRHALPNALVPTLNITALNLAYLIGGVVIVEKVFSYPGFGSLLVDALQLRDLPLIEATVLIAAAVYVGANLLADIGAILLNPQAADGIAPWRIAQPITAATRRLAPQRASLAPLAEELQDRDRDSARPSADRRDRALLGALRPVPDGHRHPAVRHELEHPFGVDQLGRDVFSRVVHGAHIVILLSLSGTLLGLVIGAVIGLLSGYVGGWLDDIVQRLLEALISIPFLVLALIAIVAAGPELAGNPVLVILVVALVYAPRIARMARAAALDIVTRDYVTAARLRGESAWSVVRREVLPNASGVLLVEFALRAGYAPVLIGSLGFLGFGMRPPTPEWGLMISENRALIIVSPITVIGPGLMLASLVVGLNLFTEGLARMLGRTVKLVEK